MVHLQRYVVNRRALGSVEMGALGVVTAARGAAAPGGAVVFINPAGENSPSRGTQLHFHCIGTTASPADPHPDAVFAFETDIECGLQRVRRQRHSGTAERGLV